MYKITVKSIYFLSLFVLLILLFLVYTFLIKKPSNDRNWESGFERLPIVNFNEDGTITVSDIRDWSYNEDGPISIEYISKTYNPSQIKNVYFLMEPFSKWKAIAHTFLEFEFNDGEKVFVSVEARREVGEDFNAFYGLYNNYELINVWGTERDLVGQRLIVEKSDIYRYKMKLSSEYALNIFRELALETSQLHDAPEFYNTFSDNCTNRLAKAANAIKPGVVPYDISWVLPGYSVKFLYKIGFIETDETSESYKIKVY